MQEYIIRWLIRILHWANSMRARRNLNRVRNITVMPYLKMESQIILLLIIIASLGKSTMLSQLLKQQGLPEVDIDVFSGDPLKYHYFMEIFKEVVEKRTEDPRGRLARLIKYTTGEAKDLIKHCVQHFEGYSNWAKIGYVNVRYKCYDRCYHLGAHY